MPQNSERLYKNHSSLGILTQSEHSFRSKMNTDSGAKWTRIPVLFEHSFSDFPELVFRFQNHCSLWTRNLSNALILNIFWYHPALSNEVGSGRWQEVNYQCNTSRKSCVFDTRLDWVSETSRTACAWAWARWISISCSATIILVSLPVVLTHLRITLPGLVIPIQS